MTDAPKTGPLREDAGETTNFSVRLPAQLVDRMDTRRNGLTKPLSRNAWLEKTLEWVLTNLPTGLAHPERDRVATDAPDDVTGSDRLPPAPHLHRWQRTGNDKLCPDCGEIRKIPQPKQEAF